MDAEDEAAFDELEEEDTPMAEDVGATREGLPMSDPAQESVQTPQAPPQLGSPDKAALNTKTHVPKSTTPETQACADASQAGAEGTATAKARLASKRPTFKKVAKKPLVSADATATQAAHPTVSNAASDKVEAASEGDLDAANATLTNGTQAPEAGEPSTAAGTAPAHAYAASDNDEVAPAIKALATGCVEPKAAPRRRLAVQTSKGSKAPVSKAAKNGTSTKRKTDKKQSQPRAKSAYQFFCQEARAELKAESPELTLGDLSKLQAELWKALPADSKQPYQKLAEEDKLRVQALKAQAEEASLADPAAADVQSDDPTAAQAAAAPADKLSALLRAALAKNSEGKKEGKKSKSAASASRKRKASTAPPRPEAESEESEELLCTDEGPDWDQHKNCDFTAHSPLAIIARTMNGEYVVAREGLPLDDFVLVNINAAKRQCLDGEGSSNAQTLPQHLINEFEQMYATFVKEIHARTSHRTGLDLDDLPPDSLLQTCSFLGSLRDGGDGILADSMSKLKKLKLDYDDVIMKVPTMGTSFVVHSLLMAERKSTARQLAARDAAHKQQQKQIRASMAEALAKGTAEERVAAFQKIYQEMPEE